MPMHPITLTQLFKLPDALSKALVSSVKVLQHNDETANKTVSRVTSDSRDVKPGAVFVALSGSKRDGHQFVEQAVKQGAIAVVVSSEKENYVRPVAQSNPDISFYSSENCYQMLAALSSNFYGNPGQQMRMIGVTGTNGKTTVTHMIEQLLINQNERVGLIGTLGHKSSAQPADSGGDGYQATNLTTPMAPALQSILYQMKNETNNAFVVMEVSSHALEQQRVFGCDFEVAVLTNLTQDHLDYHKTMANYCEAKALLFKQLSNNTERPRTAVLNLDTDYAQSFIEACPSWVNKVTYSIFNASADISIQAPNYTIAGSTFTLVTPKGSKAVSLKLGGQFSVYNALAAVAAGMALGFSLDACVDAIESIAGIRGRFELVAEQPYVLVDYAHTPDGLENVLQAARLVTPDNGRLIAVFGCGGDRDATKRPKMAHIAEKLADILMITSDNPRTEDPQQIITDVISGIERFDPSAMVVEVDRKLAIHQAIDMATENDIIVIAGKGHEDYQILSTETIHFDDREVVQSYIQQRKATLSI
ncbi:MAG: UDP-N-acetylmuramoyl-L-alanyl-D-glutamate--2,6-diaminopimelate ligase [Cyanobacteria bacterium P01_H01_bin.74]